jgi:putative ABC transport system permease protein
MSPAAAINLQDVLAALVLVAIAAAISRWQRAELERDIGVAVVRSFAQLSAVGFVIRAILNSHHIVYVVVLLAAMVVLGAFTARGRAKGVPNALGPLLIALGVAVAGTVGLVVALGVFAADARSLVPVGGMVVGNAMTAAGVALNRLGDEMARSSREVEAALSLGATARQAAAPLARRSLRSGLIPLIDQTKTTGVIAFPGTMVGMLLAGAQPFDAVRLQLVLLYVLLGAVAISALIAVTLAQRAFFTADEQLRDLPPAEEARPAGRRRLRGLRS